jgi:RHS repeat-associated protein
LATLTDPSGTTTYTWNARNQLVSLSSPSVTASFQYDARGRRKSKTVNGVTTDFLYDGHSVVQELSGGSVQANLLLGSGIDEVLQRTDTSTSSFLADGLGSTLALTDNTGTVQTEYTYEPFGNTTTSGAASTNSSQYTGRENDGTGLYYYRARYYHPRLQRFISQDPIEIRGGSPNLYEYVIDDPINRIDPYGTFWINGLAGGIAGGVGAYLGGGGALGTAAGFAGGFLSGALGGTAGSGAIIGAGSGALGAALLGGNPGAIFGAALGGGIGGALGGIAPQTPGAILGMGELGGGYSWALGELGEMLWDQLPPWNMFPDPLGPLPNQEPFSPPPQGQPAPDMFPIDFPGDPGYPNDPGYPGKPNRPCV